MASFAAGGDGDDVGGGTPVLGGDGGDDGIAATMVGSGATSSGSAIVGAGGGGGGGGPPVVNTACAACKFQRRRCSSECVLAPYFPAENTQRFMNCKRLFGVSNMVRYLKEVEPHERDDTMHSLMFEADARERDPVRGCAGIVSGLREQLIKMSEELSIAKDQLSFFLQQQHHQHFLFQQQAEQQPPPPPPPHQMHVGELTINDPGDDHHSSSLQQHLHHPGFPMAIDLRHQLLRPTIASGGGAAAAAAASPDFNNFFDNDEHRLSEEMAPLEHELKSAAALFRLTSQQQQRHTLN